MVLRLNHAPASDIARAINRLLSSEGDAYLASERQADERKKIWTRSVVIVPEMVGNSLVIGGDADAVEEVRKLVAELDHASAMIRLEVVVGEVPIGETADMLLPVSPRRKRRSRGRCRPRPPRSRICDNRWRRFSWRN